MTDPTPTPTAPDWRALCQELRDAYAESQTIQYGPWAGVDYGPSSLLDRADAALATPPAVGATTAPVVEPADMKEREALATWLERHYEYANEVNRPDWARMSIRAASLLRQATPPAPPLEPRGCPLPGACSCPTAPIVPPELIQALVWSEAALADIGDAEREPGDDLAWAERRAAQELPRIRQVLQTWRHHATPPAATLKAGPLPQVGAEISDEELAEVASAAGLAWETWEDELFAFARAVWDRAVLARWGGAAVQPVVELPPRPPMTHSVDRFDLVRYGVTWEGSKDKPLLTPRPDGYWTPWHIAAQLPQPLPVPAADKGEVQA